MILKNLQGIGTSKGIILDKSLLKLLNVNNNDMLELSFCNDSIIIKKHIETNGNKNIDKKVG